MYFKLSRNVAKNCDHFLADDRLSRVGEDFVNRNRTCASAPHMFLTNHRQQAVRARHISKHWREQQNSVRSRSRLGARRNRYTKIGMNYATVLVKIE